MLSLHGGVVTQALSQSYLTTLGTSRASSPLASTASQVRATSGVALVRRGSCLLPSAVLCGRTCSFALASPAVLLSKLVGQEQCSTEPIPV